MGSLPKNHENPVIFDVGANCGNFANSIYSLFPHAQLLLFEPSSNSADSLRKRFHNNKSISVHQIAIGDKDETGLLYFDRPGSPLASLIKRDLRFIDMDFFLKEEVQVVTLDSFCVSNNTLPEILKLDVEGTELAILQSSTYAINFIRIIQFEFGGANKDSRTYFFDFFNLLTSQGFNIYRITPTGPKLIPRYMEIDEHFRTTNYLAVREYQRTSSS